MNYVTLVNNTIQESGADLSEFETDGSDWDSYANTDMKSRFKTWVKRAWRSIQQEAFDWEWMSQQAIVNCTPGFMFYTNDERAFPSSATLIDLKDVDGTIVQPQVSVSSFAELTGEYTNLERFGYANVDTTISPINYSLKAGGEYFEIPETATLVRFYGVITGIG